MTILLVASSKGGAGKTTFALNFGCWLARNGVETVLVDADPNAPHGEWARKTTKKFGGLENGLTLVSCFDEGAIGVELRRIEHRHPDAMIIVDVEGRGSERTLHSMMVADAVIVPMMTSGLDAQETVKTFEIYANIVEARDELFPCAALFSRMPTVGGLPMRQALEGHLSRNGIEVIETAMMDRPILRDMTLWGGSLWQIKEAAQREADEAANAKTRKSYEATADRAAAAIDMLEVVCAEVSAFATQSNAAATEA